MTWVVKTPKLPDIGLRAGGDTLRKSSQSNGQIGLEAGNFLQGSVENVVVGIKLNWNMFSVPIALIDL